MRKCDRYFSGRGYRYAPESFRFFWNGKQIPLSSDQQSKVAVEYISKGWSAAVAMLKRITRRKAQKRTAYATVGFYRKGQPRNGSFLYIRNLYARYDNLPAMLLVFKEARSYFAEHGGQVTTITTGTLDGYYRPVHKETYQDVDEVEINRPRLVFIGAW